MGHVQGTGGPDDGTITALTTQGRESMPKTDGKPRKPPYTFEPWLCVHGPEKSQIEAYIMATGKREVIAEAVPTAGNTAEEVAEFIVRTVNDIEKRELLINEMLSALEICLECEGLNWSAEHDAEVAERHAKLRA